MLKTLQILLCSLAVLQFRYLFATDTRIRVEEARFSLDNLAEQKRDIILRGLRLRQWLKIIGAADLAKSNNIAGFNRLKLANRIVLLVELFVSSVITGLDIQ